MKVVIEIPKDCRLKYELNKDSGLLEVDRVLKKPYPCERASSIPYGH